MTRLLSKLLASPGGTGPRTRVSIPAAAVTALLAVTAAGTSIPMLAQSQEKAPSGGVNPQADTVKRFHDRIAGYVKLQKSVEKALTGARKNEDATQVDADKKALAEQMRQARKGAAQGELFGDAAPMFRTMLSKDQAARSPNERREVLKEVPARKPPAVNAEYPTEAPLATVPPLLLKRLPPLPEGLEYRFMEHDLILRDTRANIIADVLPDVWPGR